MLRERLISIFNELGIDEYREIKSEDIIFSQEVLNQCARNTCGYYGRNHSCPPGAGTLEERRKEVMKYERAFLINKILSIMRGEMTASMDTLNRINRELRRIFAEEDVLILGAGPCTTCKECTALVGKPCRFPDKIQYSMEGSGIDVVRMSINNKMTYNAGRGKAGFFLLVLFNE